MCMALCPGCASESKTTRTLWDVRERQGYAVGLSVKPQIVSSKSSDPEFDASHLYAGCRIDWDNPPVGYGLPVATYRPQPAPSFRPMV